jgi:coenzyme F420-reducing hydrogenase alpha subunit
MEVTTMRKELEELEKVLPQFLSLPENRHDRFLEVFSSFNERAKDIISVLEEKMQQAEQEFKKLVSYYGEDSTTCDSEQFFTTIATFCASFEKAMEDNERERSLAERAQKRAAQKKNKKEKDLKKTQPNLSTGTEEKEKAEEGVIDDIISSLREGEVFRNRRRNTLLSGPPTPMRPQNTQSPPTNVAMSLIDEQFSKPGGS